MRETIKNYSVNIKHKMNIISFFTTIFLHSTDMQDDFFISIKHRTDCEG